MTRAIRITTLVENTAGPRGTLAEHGLAFWIEADGRKILFDTGQGGVLAHNARRLGVRLEQAEAVVLSHGHYDHTGGLPDAFRREGAVKLYAHPEAFAPRYARNADGSARVVGVAAVGVDGPPANAEFIPVDGPVEIVGGLRLTGPVPRETDFEDTGGAFFLDRACTRPDVIVDDQAAFAETALGTVVILGCAHAGVVNTLRYIQTLTGGAPMHTVVGGSHLLHAGPERMEKTLAVLQELDIQDLRLCHCTGFAAAAQIWRAFPDRCRPCPVGTTIEVTG